MNNKGKGKRRKSLLEELEKGEKEKIMDNKEIRSGE